MVENRTGAGSLIAANHLYRVSKPDGLSIGHFIGGFFLGQVLDQPGIEFMSGNLNIWVSRRGSFGLCLPDEGQWHHQH